MSWESFSEAILTVRLATESTICGHIQVQKKSSALRPHRNMQHTSPRIKKKPVFVLLSYDKSFCLIFSITPLQYQPQCMHDLMTYISELQNGICRMSQGNNKGTSLAWQRALFPLKNRAVDFWREKPVKIYKAELKMKNKSLQGEIKTTRAQISLTSTWNRV